MVGSRFCELQNSFSLTQADLNGQIALDITNKESILNFFSSYDFDIVVLFSAFTGVDAAERQRNDKTGLAWKINVDGLKSTVDACQKYHKKLVFISTDFVFDGVNGPYSESAPRAMNADRVSWYGITKIKGEEEIEKTLQDYLIVRISYPYRSEFKGKNDFARSILEKYDIGKLHPMFTDQLFTPTFADDVAPALKLLIDGNHNGIYHIASPKTTSPYEFARYLLLKFQKGSDSLKSSSLVEFLKKTGSTPRPVKGGLKTEKIEELGYLPTSWQRGIDNMYIQLHSALI